MIKRFIAWIVGSHEKRSQNILKSFTTINTELQALNLSITEKQAKNQRKMHDLLAENEALAVTLGRNAKVATNIANLLGD